MKSAPEEDNFLQFQKRKWCLVTNCSIIKDKEYLKQMNRAIDGETSRNNMELNESDMRGNDNISYSLFLENIITLIKR